MIAQYLMASLLGGLICLDRIIVQSMIARPVIAAPLMGFFLGDPYTGLLIGAFVELFWLDRLPIGTHIPPNDSLTAILVTASSIFSARMIGHHLQEIAAFSILLYLPCGYAGQQLEVFYMRLNDRLARSALRCADQTDVNGVAARHLLSPVLYFLLNVSFILLFLLPGTAITAYLFPRFSPPVLKALNLLFFFFPLLGIAVALNTIHLKKMIPVFCILFLAASLILELAHVF